MEVREGFTNALQNIIPFLDIRQTVQKCFSHHRDSNIDFETVTEWIRNPKLAPPKYEKGLRTAKFIINNFDLHNEVQQESLDGTGNGFQTSTSIPTLTFGEIEIPERFTDTEHLHRNYILFSPTNSMDKVWELLTKKWGCPVPMVVLSFTSGNIQELTKDPTIQDKFVQVIYEFCKTTGVWILSDGYHTGVSKLLGRVFESGQHPCNTNMHIEAPREVTMIGISDWEKLKDQTLLHGISLEKLHTSYYFYPRKRELEAGDVENMLNPYQRAYLLFKTEKELNCCFLQHELEAYLARTGSSKSLDHTLSFEDDVHDSNNLPRTHKKTYHKAKFYESVELTDVKLSVASKEIFTPVVTCVVGGDPCTLGHVSKSLESRIPVIIVPQSGHIPHALTKIYCALESVKPRYCNRSPGWLDEEEQTLSSVLHCEACKCLFAGQADNCTDVLRQIMKNRYNITIMDLERERETILTDFITGVYKPCSEADCLKIALQTNSVKFLRAVQNKELELDFDQSQDSDPVTLLQDLHVTNFKKNSHFFNIRLQKRFVTRKKNVNKVLPLVGKIIFSLSGKRYCIFYQEQEVNAIVAGELKEPLERNWHHFLYAALAQKTQIAKYFLTRTRCPLGAALFACVLFQGMAQCAQKRMASEKADKLVASANQFEQFAIDILEIMHKKSPKEAYISLIREVPFKLGPFVTPFSLAQDANAMNFIESPSCQTYLRRLWVKNMLLSLNERFLFPILTVVPPICLPLILTKIHFEETVKPSDYVEQWDRQEEESEEKEKHVNRKNPVCGPCRTKGCWWKIKSFYTAPLTKYNMSMVSYVTFLGVLSYFFLTELQPKASIWDICAVEWVCYAWFLGFLIEESSQFLSIKPPKYKNKCLEMHSEVWPFYWRWFFYLRLYYPKMYLNSNWNSVDIVILSFWAITIVCRHITPHEGFQIVRILYSVVVIAFFFRSLRFFYVMKQLGPKIVAIQKMLRELALFMIVMIVFIMSFGIAFQGLLNPQQPPSITVLLDIIWRPYWAMHGEFYVDEDDIVGMGRLVGNSSCLKAMEEQGKSFLACYPYAAIILLWIFVFIANILLLNLLIAIFSNTFNKVEEAAETHWAFQRYNIIQEYYHKCWLPPPLNTPWQLVKGSWLFIRLLFRPCIQKRSCYRNDHFRMNTVLDDLIPKNEDQPQREALKVLQRKAAHYI